MISSLTAAGSTTKPSSMYVSEQRGIALVDQTSVESLGKDVVGVPSIDPEASEPAAEQRGFGLLLDWDLELHQPPPRPF